MRESKFKDEKLGKTLIRYLKSYESFEIIKNKLQEQTEMEMLEKEKNAGRLGLSVDDLTKQIKICFITKVEGNLNLIERAQAYKNLTTNVLGKILKKINDNEAYLSTRTRNMIFLRKENGRLINGMKVIKDQVSTKFFFIF